MRTLLLAGLLYILSIGIVLALRPTLMFTDEGTWKEFRIGGDQTRTTWFPFWLFTLASAIVCFLLVAIGERLVRGVASATAAMPTLMARAPSAAAPAAAAAGTLRPGYYLLNSETPTVAGVPHYIYIGAEPPKA